MARGVSSGESVIVWNKSISPATSDARHPVLSERLRQSSAVRRVQIRNAKRGKTIRRFDPTSADNVQQALNTPARHQCRPIHE